MNEITNTGEIEPDDDNGEPRDPRNYLVATTAPENKGIEFHVSMRNHTFEDMEALIVEAAAQLIVGRRNDREMARAIEAKCLALVDEKATAKLASITDEIIDQPMTPKFASDKPQVTMREMLGLFGREYLTALVNRDGKPATEYYDRQSAKPRIEHIVANAMDAKFKAEIEKATNAVVAEIKAAILSRHNAMLAAEKARFLEALAKVTA